jgi:hypothetical protein
VLRIVLPHHLGRNESATKQALPVPGQQAGRALGPHHVEADAHDHGRLQPASSQENATAKWTRPNPESAPRSAGLSSQSNNHAGACSTTRTVQKRLQGARTKNHPAAQR